MIKCKNRHCKFHEEKDKCSLKNTCIGIDASCENFEKGFLYYFIIWVTKVEQIL